MEGRTCWVKDAGFQPLKVATSAPFLPQREHEKRREKVTQGMERCGGAKRVGRGCPERLWMPIQENVQGQMRL